MTDVSPDERDRQVPGGPPNPSLAKAIEEHHRLFLTTADPLELWGCYWLCRQAQCQIPEWIYVEFDRLFRRLLTTAYDPPERWTRSAAYVLFGTREVLSPSGGRDLFRKSIWQQAAYLLAKQVRVLVDGPDQHNETDACYLVAQDQHVSESTVRRAWRQFQVAARVDTVSSQRSVLDVLDRQAAEAERLLDQEAGREAERRSSEAALRALLAKIHPPTQ